MEPMTNWELKEYLKETEKQLKRYFSGNPDEGFMNLRLRLKVLRKHKTKIDLSWSGLD